MIARIMYRQSVQGVLNYVLGKKGMIVLGFQNTYSESSTDPRLFGNILYHLGQRHQSIKRYAHISLNLPFGEHLNNGQFYKIAQDYMEQMGYEKQPYVVVRHNDTKHEHIHIVTTTVKEDGLMIDLSHDYRRNVATQKYLEKKYGLSQSPETKSTRQLPVYRLPELQFGTDTTNGNRFYIQEVLNNTLQRYKVRNIQELAKLIKPYHIVVKKSTNNSGRIGVTYGLDNQKVYKTRFIDGYQVHPKLSGPKLEAVFAINAKSKLLPMHKKRIEKQLTTTLKLFKTIRFEDLPDVLKSYQNIDCELQYGKKQKLNGLTIFDKSGYVFDSSEINQGVNFMDNPQLLGNDDDQTRIDIENGQYLLEVRKMIKNAIYESYLGSNKNNMLLSEFVMTKDFKEMLPMIAKSESFVFLDHYSSKNNNQLLLQILRQEFEGTRKIIHSSEVKREIKGLEKRVALLRKVLEVSVFDAKNNSSITFFLLQGLGLKFGNGRLSYLNSNTLSVPMALGEIILPKTNSSFISTGTINENMKVLEKLTNEIDSKDIDLNPASFFLPLMLPELYETMRPEYRQKFDKLSLKAYQRISEQFHVPYEKSPIDYIKLFNAKGFYFEYKVGAIHIGSIYSKDPVSIPLTPKTQAYLKSIENLDGFLNQQKQTIDKIQDNGQDQLDNLWVSYLIERQLYKKAAYMMIYKGASPNLPTEVFEHHMDNGLRDKIMKISQQKTHSKRAAILRQSVSAFCSLLDGTDSKAMEAFNGFKDELTANSKNRGLFK